MDWKIIIVIYSYFQTLQSEHLDRADRQYFTKLKLTLENNQCDGFGGGSSLCAGCNHISDLLEIYPAKSLFVNLTLIGTRSTFNVTVKTQKDQSATLDAVSKTLVFNNLKVSFSMDVTEGHRYASLAVQGNECRLSLGIPKMYYYSVRQQTRLLTIFPANPAPNQLKKIEVVDAICAPNAGYLEKPTMKIYSNGTFELQGSCECNPGFELNGTNCSGRLLALLLCSNI